MNQVSCVKVGDFKLMRLELVLVSDVLNVIFMDKNPVKDDYDWSHEHH